MSRSNPSLRRVGDDYPSVVRSYEPGDKYYWKRTKAAKDLGIPEEELEDEPDNDPSDPEQAGWEQIKEGE